MNDIKNNVDQYVKSCDKHLKLMEDILAHREVLISSFQKLDEFQQHIRVCTTFEEFYFQKDMNQHIRDYNWVFNGDLYRTELSGHEFNEIQREESDLIYVSKDISNLKSPLMMLFFIIDEIFKRNRLESWLVPHIYGSQYVDLVKIVKACRNVMGHWYEGISNNPDNQNSLKPIMEDYFEHLNRNNQDDRENIKRDTITDFFSKTHNIDIWQIPLYVTFALNFSVNNYVSLVSAIAQAPLDKEKPDFRQPIIFKKEGSEHELEKEEEEDDSSNN